jgi:hypothetical protein
MTMFYLPNLPSHVPGLPTSADTKAKMAKMLLGLALQQLTRE